jgi:diguanylate cyclase (GGDEF)-like protein
MAYGGIAGIALLNWLAGGGSSAYEDLYVLWLGTGAPHPPRRAMPHLAVMVAALALPLLYEDTSGVTVGDMAAEALILVVLGVLLSRYQESVRRQRAGLQEGQAVERRLARVDELTGLGNRRAFDEAVTVESVRAARESVALTVGLVDVDSLRRINEQYGHLEGDTTLRDVARAMERSLRATDRCFRWGGDEFAVVMPDTDAAGAEPVLERMAAAVGEGVRAPDGRRIELTWGAAQLESAGSAADVLAAADLALLDRKTEKRR